MPWEGSQGAKLGKTIIIKARKGENPSEGEDNTFEKHRNE